MVRLSLVHFLVAATAGAFLLVRPALGLGWAFPAAIHVELALVGFMLQFALGVAVWILPRPVTPPGLPALPAAWLLNGGILCVVGAGWWPWLLLPGRLAEVMAVLLLALHIVPRVRAVAAAPH